MHVPSHPLSGPNGGQVGFELLNVDFLFKDLKKVDKILGMEEALASRDGISSRFQRAIDRRGPLLPISQLFVRHGVYVLFLERLQFFFQVNDYQLT